ncbi:MFS transporter [Flavobacterium qiangtangense]|uniref:MFS transporter n=1 Tax=Flavobacterium qiangtangense TaxID=1442595 RepID=A0ABW1PKZ7_9FLAO
MESQSLSKSQITIMAIAAGVCVANIYYNQPVLKDIARSLGTTEANVGLISVLAQAGYGFGLFFITPLGDKINRKKLILGLQGLLIIALLGMVFLQSRFGIFAMSLIIGICSVAAQVILPMAASLEKVNKAKTISFIFSGILIGILAARVFAGTIAEWFGWHYVYAISAVMVLGTAVMVHLSLPNVKQEFTGNYISLLKSALQQIQRFAILRRSTLLGALIFGAFCSFWTTLTFHLSGAPFNYGTDTIGLFGILAIAGALLAPYFGRLVDGGNATKSQLFSVGMLLVSVILLHIFPHSVWAIIIAVLLLDVGVQATQLINIATIYTLDEKANSRINTIYMTSYFIGGAVGTFVGVLCWKYGGWDLVTWQLILWSAIAFAVAFYSYKNKS